MFSLTLQFTSIADLSAAIAKLGGAEVVKPGKPAKTDSPAASSPTAAQPAAQPAAPEPKVVSYADSGISELIQEKTKNTAMRPAVAELLKKFGAMGEKGPTGKALKPEQFEAFKDALAKLEAPAEAEMG